MWHHYIGCYICVSCGSYTAQFYLDKFDESKRTLGKCILWNGSWYTPSEFESHCGKKSKKWKQSIMHSGKSLIEYSLSCPPKQGAKQVSSLADNQTHCVQDTLSQDCGQGTTMSASPLLSSQLSRPLFVNTVLSFIKAYRLKGDNESLKKRVCEHFSPNDVENAKKMLWDYCRQDLEAAGLPYHSRRGSDRRSQMAANLDDIVQAFVVLDSSDLIPGIYCEATDLLQVPSLSLDPISEKVETNTLSLQDLVSKIDHLEAKLSSYLRLVVMPIAKPPMLLLLPLLFQYLLLVPPYPRCHIRYYLSFLFHLRVKTATSFFLVSLRVSQLLALKNLLMRC